MTKSEISRSPEAANLHAAAVQFETAIQIFASLHRVQPERLFPVAEYYKLVDRAAEEKNHLVVTTAQHETPVCT